MRRNGLNPQGLFALHPRCGKIRADVDRRIIQKLPVRPRLNCVAILFWFRLCRLGGGVGSLRLSAPATSQDKMVARLQRPLGSPAILPCFGGSVDASAGTVILSISIRMESCDAA